MFHQLLTPVGNNLALSFLVAILPIATVLVLLGLLKRPAWRAASTGLAVGLPLGISVRGMPVHMAFASAFNGAVFAPWPVMWIVIGFCFGELLEGIAGFSAPVAITGSLLIMCGFPALDALVFVLIFDTTPVAFGSLGAPVTVLAAVTGLPAAALAQMIGRQLPFITACLPLYVMALYGGWRSIQALWPMLLVAGVSFGVGQFAASNYLDYTLTDVFAALASFAATLLFLQIWRPAADSAFAIACSPLGTPVLASRPVPTWQGWMPWLIMTVTVILWTLFKVANIGKLAIPWPGLDKAVAITLYHDKPYAAVWTFQPFSTGTAVLVAALITALLVRLSPAALCRCAVRTIGQIWQAVVTVMFIVGLAYVMNYAGLAYTLGLAVASTGHAFIFFHLSSGGLRCSYRVATPRATRFSAIYKWSRPDNSSSIRCCSRPLTRRGAFSAK